jgi:hypothetical protein
VTISIAATKLAEAVKFFTTELEWTAYKFVEAGRYAVMRYLLEGNADMMSLRITVQLTRNQNDETNGVRRAKS